MKKITKILLATLAVILLIGAGGFGFIYSNLNKMYVKDEAVNAQEKEDDTEQGTEVEGITNILLVGTDGANVEKSNRSDSVMLVTIDNKNKDIKISSIARDTYVDIPGYSTEKLTHAYAYGGIDLLKEVFEVNFNIKVDKYIAVNFVSFMDIMDELGGVEVNVEEKDVKEVNKYIDACYDYYYDRKDEVEKQYITKAGKQRLNGYQALAFSRIRYQDSTDARNSRQRMVVKAALENLKKSGISGYIGSLNLILSGVKTNLSPTEIVILGYKVLRIGPDNMKALEFPYYKEEVRLKEAGWVVLWDKDKNLQLLDSFLYND